MTPINHYNIFHASMPVLDMEPIPNEMVGRDESILLMNLCSGMDVLEIGTYKGITTENILSVAKSVVSIDVTEVPLTLDGCQTPSECLPMEFIGTAITEANRPKCKLFQYNPNDEAGLRTLLKKVGQLYDVIVIDGDHSRDGVERDYTDTHKYLKADGIVIFHDCWWDVHPQPVTGPTAILSKIGGYIINKTHYGIPIGHARKIGATPI